MTATRSWPEPVWTAIHTSDTDLHRLATALQGLRAVCSTAAASLSPTDEFHPAASWLSADGLLALLELTGIAGPATEWTLDEPPDPTTAAAAVDQLLAQTTTLAHALADDAAAARDGERARVMAEVVKQLALGRQLTHGPPW